MSRVIRDVKILESPFPHGLQREQMHSGCCPLQHSSLKFYKVFINLKVILSTENVIGSIRNGFHGVLKMNLVVKLRELLLLY